MSPSKRDNRAILIFIVALLLIAPLALILFNNDVELRGTAIIQEATSEADDLAASGAPDDEGGEAETPLEATAVPPTAVIPTAVPATEVPPTAVPPTSVPEVTEEADPEILPEVTAEPEPESTAEVDPEATAEVEPEATAEVDPEATAEVTPEIEPEATDEPDTVLTASGICVANGGQFVLTNAGADDENGAYVIVDADGGEIASGDFALGADESLTLDVGFGAYSLSSDAGSASVDCAQAVEIVVSYECTVADGVIFSIANAGGPQSEATAYSLDGVDGSFIIEGEDAFTLEAGYGLPVLMIGDAVYSPEESCDEPGEIRGAVWDDADGNAMFGSRESGLADVRVLLVNDEGVTIEALTEADGSYIFVHLAAGEYTVSVDWETVPADYVWTYDLDGGEDASVFVTVGIGESVVSDFGFREQVPVTVTGVVWNDVNGDAFVSDGESGLANVAVLLLQGGEVVQSALTNENGVYSFSDVLAGDYVVALDPNTLTAGFIGTYDLDGGRDNRSAIQVENGVDVSRVDFGVALEANGVIDGFVWVDPDMNWVQEDGEAGLPGVTIFLVNAYAPEQPITAVSNAEGYYRFEGLPAGSYDMWVDLTTLPAGYEAADGGESGADLETGTSEARVPFPVQAWGNSSISGFVWLELGNYGVYDSNESGFNGLTVELLDARGDVVDSVTLGADGVYHFGDLLPGAYTVSVVTSNIPSKVIATASPDGNGAFTASLTLGVDDAIQGVDFGILGTF